MTSTTPSSTFPAAMEGARSIEVPGSRRAHLAIALCILAVAAGCKRSESVAGGAFPELSASAARPALLSGAPPPKPPFPARMKNHALLAGAARDAVVRGDIVAARASAHQLAEGRGLPETQAEPGFEPELDAMVLAARSLGDARDIDDAAHRLGALAATCGSCHAQFGGPRLATTEPPPGWANTTSRMARHAWAAERLWEGLVAPSSDAWTRGARVLGDVPLVPERLTPGKTPVKEIDALAKAVYDRARDASQAEDIGRRAEIYGQLVTTCGNCHARLGGGPRVPRP